METLACGMICCWRMIQGHYKLSTRSFDHGSYLKTCRASSRNNEIHTQATTESGTAMLACPAQRKVWEPEYVAQSLKMRADGLRVTPQPLVVVATLSTGSRHVVGGTGATRPRTKQRKKKKKQQKTKRKKKKQKLEQGPQLSRPHAMFKLNSECTS